MILLLLLLFLKSTQQVERNKVYIANPKQLRKFQKFVGYLIHHLGIQTVLDFIESNPIKNLI
jgi:uncharacterized membrane protein